MTDRIETSKETASYLVWRETVIREMHKADYRLPDDWFRQHDGKFHRAYDIGEPVWNFVETLKLIRDHTKIAPHKSPRDLALRVVRVGA